MKVKRQGQDMDASVTVGRPSPLDGPADLFTEKLFNSSTRPSANRTLPRSSWTCFVQVKLNSVRAVAVAG